MNQMPPRQFTRPHLITEAARLQLHRKYLVTWKLKGVHKKEHRFVGQYLGMNKFDELVWNLRPFAGTSEIAVASFISAHETNEPAGLLK